ncbi:AMP-dependent synthetase/ligase [Polaribacter dokdonensis]|uniref:Long-chain acyl-CoA synthetase n=1 Tax=Polaribacter dokdonensis DSW-5 TaxID=1300348 RepID=A0A0M9CH19_9FLAO|nr:long-chain fatty acid--CoA ligase [Polaribacter dokdonensis]KOY52313.1 Long-chain fatty-acid-CoA ligase [Polaribacter dokdonensis DSW-5]SEE43163.1 long-chain acyl-CoA synthetase [Polaribacter dokdonensis DSW-5]
MPDAITRIFDFAYYQLENEPLENCLNFKNNGNWNSISTKTFTQKANEVSSSLLSLGIKPNDKIAVITENNNPNWHILDIGILQIGAQNVPLYATLSENDYAYILNHSDSKYCFVSSQELYKKVKTVLNKTQLKNVFSLEELNTDYDWNSFLSLGKKTDNSNKIEALKAKIKPEDLATIIYTSGTTGTPKGVMLTHKNIVFTVFAITKRLNLQRGNNKIISYLPICHIFERSAFYYNLYMSVQVYFAENIEQIGETIKDVKPDYLAVVPRLLEKIYDKIVDKGSNLSGLKKRLFFWALELGENYEPYNLNGSFYNFKLSIARKLIFKKWKEALGNNLQFMISGSAPLQPKLIRVFTAAGIPIYEGYGMTESSPAGTLNDERNNGLKIGSVGKPLEGIAIKIANDGEILMKGDHIMLGYFKNKELTDKTIIKNYLHTGDIGEIDKNGFLSITGRKKEMFKTSGGKYIAPAVLESEFKQSRFIEQIMVVGENQKMPAAIIQLNFEFLKEWANRHQYKIDEFHSNEKVTARIQKEIDFYNNKFGKWEKIKRFELTPDEWTIDDGLLTPTLKIKRNNIRDKYNNLYEKIYN